MTSQRSCFPGPSGHVTELAVKVDMVTWGVTGVVADGKTEMGLLCDLMKQKIHSNDMMSLDPWPLGSCAK